MAVEPKKISELNEVTAADDSDNLVIVTGMGSTPVTKRIRADNLIPVPEAPDLTINWINAGETWTYASATTFTVEGNQIDKYVKGTRIRLTQTTIKYFVVVGASYGANTTVTVTGGTDYSLASAAIVGPQLSYGTPPDWPGWFNYTPTPSASGSMTFTSTSVIFAVFSVIGNTAIVQGKITGTTGGTASTAIKATLPIDSALLTANTNFKANVYANVSDGTFLSGFGELEAGTPDVVAVRRYDGANWGLGASRSIGYTAIYQI